LAGGIIFAGKYRVIEELGHGGMGIVYKAEDLKLRRPVALKVLRRGTVLDAEAKNRLVLEAQAAAALSHPNICMIYEVEESEGQPYIAMEYVEGQSLKAKISCEIPLGIGEILDVTLEAAEGLAEAHRSGIVHRDIKTSNIMLTDKGRAKIMDFGLAKLSGRGALTAQGTVQGTVAYMSPEQARGDPLDERTDIWSLGVVLYELLTCHLPFQGETDQAVIYSILNRRPASATEWRADAPRGLVKIIERCLEKNRSDRYRSVAELKADLLRFKHRQGLDAGPPLRLSGVWPWVVGAIALVVISWLGYKMIDKSRVPEKGLAVLPLEVIGNDPADKAIGRGIEDTLTSQLTQLEGFEKVLWVVPTSDVRKMGITSAVEARKSLGVALVINGSVERVGGALRLILNLIDARTPRQLRSTTIAPMTEEVANLQGAVVDRVVGMLDIVLKPGAKNILSAGGTSVRGAYECYLQARGYTKPSGEPGALDLDSAISFFRRALELDPSYALAHAGLAEAYWSKYEATKDTAWVERAKLACDRAIQIDDRLAPIHVAMGVIHAGTGRYEEAIKEFKRALAQDKRNFDAALHLAGAYQAVNKTSAAEAAYKKAVRLRPGYWSGYSYLGVFYYDQGRYAEAERMFKQVIDLTPDNKMFYNGYNQLGVIYLLTGRKDEARVMFEKSISIVPSADACSNLGTLHFYKGEYAEAVAAYEKAVGLDPQNYQAWGNLGDGCRSLAGASGRALEAYRQAIRLALKEAEINPRDVLIHNSLSGYYANTGDFKNALVEIGTARNLAPNDISVLRKCVLVFEIAGLRNRALGALEEYVARGGSLEVLVTDPALADLAKDSRFRKIVDKGPKTGP
jgi:Flp pilus assembly protein TadD/TolB-like protein/predicted Ser/Thr protein kinase